MKYRVIVIAPFYQNCLLIWCEFTNEAVIIDPGGEAEKICKEVDKLKINVKKILLTHGHIDHVGEAIRLKQYYTAPIIGPNKQDKWLLDNLYLQYSMLGWNKSIINYSLIPDSWLEEGDIVKIGREILNVLHCPGHSPGHIIFFNKIRKFIVMGDVLFESSIGRTDLPGGNEMTLLNSIKNKLFVLEDDIVFYPGHGGSSTLKNARKNLFLTNRNQ